MKYFVYLFLILILLGLNVGLFNYIRIFGQMPNLLFLLALCASLEKNDFDFYFIAFVGGLFLDFFSTGFFGGYTFSFLVVSLLAHFFADNVLVSGFNWKTLSGVLLVGFLVFSWVWWLYSFVSVLLGLAPDFLSLKEFLLTLVPGIFYNLLLLYPIYILNNLTREFLNNWHIRRRGVIY